MGLLKEATVEQAAAKVGIFGSQGSGKTTTSALIAIGLSKTYHGGAPVAMMDTENGSDFLVPIFAAEGVKLLNFKSRAFKDMCTGIREAEEQGACCYLVDSYTHPWQELNEALKAKLKVSRLEFRHMDQLKSMWRGWTDAMLNSPLHVIVSGRLGYVWDREEDENGKKGDLIKLGTKMKSESEAGYEPSLLIEMEGIQEAEGRLRKTRTKKGSISHHAYVLKDRWRALNGRTFTFKDINTYKAGDFQRVYKEFAPHFSKLAVGKAEQRAMDGARSSEALFDGAGDNAYQQRVRRVQITLEEIQGTLVKLWPGQDAKSKALKALAIETLFETRSWMQVESLSLERLELALDALGRFEMDVEDGKHDAVSDAAPCTALLRDCVAAEIAQRKQAEETVGIL
jgi:AAA domain-containing protein